MITAHHEAPPARRVDEVIADAVERRTRTMRRLSEWPVSLQVHLREIGVPPQRGRTSAIRQLVLQAPAPVIAKALGYHDKTATRLVTEAGGTWSRYAPGVHQR
ncbi:hypothetical protein ABZ128_28835 [Streptomyces sp. NPDC006326]|uniref:hypothetical protein n=1 Tax=Streptomyces sp. NPDC006326 TaxID=3156752 RepID=UPI0033B7A14F